METVYSISRDGNPVGTAQILREGLFLIIRCKCQFPYEEDLCIQLIGAGKTFDLGICVPDNTGIELMTRFPARLFPDEGFEFQLYKKKRDSFYPIDPGKPFEILPMLRFSRFQIREGMPVILIEKSQ